MNALQSYSQKLVAANEAAQPSDATLIWRGQVIEHVAPIVEDAVEQAEPPSSWLDRVVTD